MNAVFSVHIRSNRSFAADSRSEKVLVVLLLNLIGVKRVHLRCFSPRFLSLFLSLGSFFSLSSAGTLSFCDVLLIRPQWVVFLSEIFQSGRLDSFGMSLRLSSSSK
ncbi:hypothetical protein XENORESO_020080 [Xenotaenia resolanae]|uniref:Uncharacterized protein n=1 Tax=Xenotaenia resolanae TaxID=208358 RepID=A0ABV0X8H1_9TELE